MSFCCENPIDLGCRSACAPITLPVVITTPAYYTLMYQFNGALISREFLATPVDGYLQIPSYMFNETQHVTFQVYDSLGVLVACFKAHILPSNSTLEPYNPPILEYIDTQISIIGQIGGCNNGLNIDQFIIALNSGFNGTKIGTIWNVDVNVIHGGNQHPYTLWYDINLTMPLTQNKFVQTSQFQVPEIYVATQLSNCNQKYTLTAVVDSLENIETGYINGTNIGDTFTKP